jgi:hypothetical protein
MAVAESPDGIQFICDTHDGAKHVRTIRKPSEIPPPGSRFTIDFESYGKLVVECVDSNEEMLHVRELLSSEDHDEVENTKGQPMRETHPLPAAGAHRYEVISWCSDDEGKKPEQVHLLFPVQIPLAHLAHMIAAVKEREEGNPDTAYADFMPVIRLKSRRACEGLIEAITNHMQHVFPGPEQHG